MEAEAGTERPRRPSLASAAFYNYASQVVAAVLSLASVLIVARELGPSGRGEVAFLTTVPMLTHYLSTLGVHEANANFAASEPAARRPLATNSVVLAGGLGALAIGVVAALVAAFPGVGAGLSPGLLALALAAVPALILQTYLTRLVQAEWAFAVANAAWLATPIANVLVNGALAAAGELTVTTAVATWVGGQYLGTLLLVWYVARRLGGFGRPDVAIARRSVGFGLKTYVSDIMQIGNYRLDQWLLGAIAGAHELGLYSVAVAWAEALFFLPSALRAVQRPDLVRASREDAARQAAAGFRAAVLLSLPVVGAMALAAPVLCVTVFGESFRGSIDDLRLLLPGALGIVAVKVLGVALVSQRRPLLDSAAVGISFALTVALDVVLIPSHGGLGAAIASTVAYTGGGIAVALLFVRALGARPTWLLPRVSDARALLAVRPWRKRTASL